jgi:phospholipid/cholesterol/gamma-HCH transport system permease protein
VNEAPDPGFRVERVDLQDGRAEVRFAGQLRFRRCFVSWDDVRRLASRPTKHLAFDLSAVDSLDGAATALLLALRDEVVARGGEAEIVGAQGGVRAMLDLYGSHPARPCLHEPPAAIGILDEIGRETLTIVGDSRGLDFIGDVALAGVQAVRAPSSINWTDVPRLAERAGADGVPIVLVINLLVGLVTAFQAALQLKQFGANVFVADLVGLSITRELAPLMTAIIVAGRSGAAFSAELGTMRVSEEIDALRTLGFDPYGFLVFPRVVTLALVLPLLTILADAIGITGGLIVATLGLDITASAYLVETQKAVGLWDVFSGCLKTVFFGVNIALIACQRGLATRGGAEGVGRATTSAVVTSLFAIVVVDAIFTVLFNAFGH